MGRYAKIGQTVENLKQMIEDNGGLKAIVDNCKLKVHKDLHKVDVGHDIIGFVGGDGVPTYEMIGEGLASFPVAWCFTHNSDELWVEFVLYIGQEGKLRAYIPTHGNNVDGHRAIPLGSVASPKRDRSKMRESVVNRISINNGASRSASANVKLTFQQLIQSLNDYSDKYASVMPHAKDAEHPVWGIQYIWFNDGVLYLGQHDDEGLTVDLIAERIQKCLPDEMLDKLAIVKVGVTDRRGGVNIDVFTQYGEPAKAHFVKSSEVKPTRNDDFCKWILKFAN